MQRADLDLDAHALAHLALERLGVGLALLDLAAGKLPQPGQYGRRTALRDEVTIAARDDGRNDAQVGGLGHDGPPYCGITCTMVKRVTPIEADALLKDGWAYLDVRSIPEFDGGHPTGAANVPLLHMAGGRMAPNPGVPVGGRGELRQGRQDRRRLQGRAAARCRRRRCSRRPATRASSTCAAGSTASATTSAGSRARAGRSRACRSRRAAPPDKTYAELEKRATTQVASRAAASAATSPPPTVTPFFWQSARTRLRFLSSSFA